MKVKYSSNNSGGTWWLKDDDWHALERAGWDVEWKDERWLGALATSASKDFPSLADAIREWERVTGKHASDEGCNCCGEPHYFSSGDEWATGADVVRVLFGSDVPTSLREAVERLEKS